MEKVVYYKKSTSYCDLTFMFRKSLVCDTLEICVVDEKHLSTENWDDEDECDEAKTLITGDWRKMTVRDCLMVPRITLLDIWCELKDAE